MALVRRLLTPLALVSWTLTAQAEAQAEAEDALKSGPSFVDRFERLDPARWYISDGWSNGAHQNCTWSHTHVKVGPSVHSSLELSLTDRANSLRPFTCAEIQTKAFLGYGAYEVRLRAVPGPGTVTAFFTYTGPPHGAGKPHDEIDFEFLGKMRRGVWLNYFLAGRGHESAVALDFDVTATTNDYAFVWLPDSIRWYANGKLIREVRKADGQQIPSQSQKLYLSLWNGTSPAVDAWLGRFAYPGAPLVALYEHVAFTRPGDACQFPGSIVCSKPELFTP